MSTKFFPLEFFHDEFFYVLTHNISFVSCIQFLQIFLRHFSMRKMWAVANGIGFAGPNGEYGVEILFVTFSKDSKGKATLFASPAAPGLARAPKSLLVQKVLNRKRYVSRPQPLPARTGRRNR